MKYVVTLRCPHGHEMPTVYEASLGRDWIEAQASRQCGSPGWVGKTPLGSTVRRAHKPGESQCSTCGDVRLTYTIEPRFDDHIPEPAPAPRLRFG